LAGYGINFPIGLDWTQTIATDSSKFDVMEAARKLGNVFMVTASQTSCIHNPYAEGEPLHHSCNEVTTGVCGSEAAPTSFAFCCDLNGGKWDANCVNEANKLFP
jgi:hypothetical protein